MSARNLVEASRLIQDGRSEEVIHLLEPLAKKKSASIAVRYVLAHAYEVVGKRQEAEIAWIQARMAMPRKDSLEVKQEKKQAPDLELGDELEAALRSIITPDESQSSEPEEDLEELSDLQRLLDELRSSRPSVVEEIDSMSTPDLENDIDGMVSETLARIYASQKQYEEAVKVYMQLAELYPEEADRFFRAADEMRALADTVTSS